MAEQRGGRSITSLGAGQLSTSIKITSGQAVLLPQLVSLRRARAVPGGVYPGDHRETS